jgi:hypothetical protein
MVPCFSRRVPAKPRFFRLSLHAFRDSRRRYHSHCHFNLGPFQANKALTSQIRRTSPLYQWSPSTNPSPIFYRLSLSNNSNSVCLSGPSRHSNRALPQRVAQRPLQWNRRNIHNSLLYLRGLNSSRACPPSRHATSVCSFTWTTYPDCTIYSLLFSRGYCLLASSSSPERSQRSRIEQTVAIATQSRTRLCIPLHMLGLCGFLELSA